MSTVMRYPGRTTNVPGIAGYRWAAAVLVVAVAFGIFANYLMSQGPGEPIRLPAAFLGNQDTVTCPEADQSSDQVSLEGTPETETLINLGAGPYDTRPGVNADALPEGGEPADQTAVTGMSETVAQLAACRNGGTAAGTRSLVTDDYWRRTNALGLGDNVGTSSVPLMGPMEGDTPAPSIEDARMFDDGRVGAIIRPGFDVPSWMYDYYIFANVDGTWLIDEAAHVTEVMAIEVTVTDDGFSPSEIIVPPVSAELVLTNNGSAPHSLVSQGLGIRIEVEPGESGMATIKRPAGTYEFSSDIPGDDPGLFSGKLTIEGEPVGTPAPSPAASEPAASALPVASLTVEMTPPEGFMPNEIYILAHRDVELTFVNNAILDRDISGMTPVANGIDGNLTIDELGISIDVAPGESETITVNAEPGTYVISSDIPGHSQVGMTGILHVVDEATPMP